MDLIKIRIAAADDLPAINAIYNQAVRQGFTADTRDTSMKQRTKWFEAHNADSHPVFVYVESGKVVGWLSFSPYRYGRQALAETAEVSYYIDKAFREKGIGSALIDFAKAEATKYSFRNLFAIILENNVGSIKLMEKSGFTKWGFLPMVANFNGHFVGHVYYGVNL